MKTSVAGKVVAITGAGRGIGAATATALAGAGAHVAIGDLDIATAKETADRIGAMAVEVDVTTNSSFDAFLDAVEAELGPLDVLINNAGIMPLARMLDEDDAMTRKILDLNTHAMIYGTRIAARRMVPRGRGHIVNVASTAGKAGVPGASTYCASKHAMVGFSEAVALELEGTGVEISCVMPFITRTELTLGVGDMRGAKSVRPEDVAAEILDALESPRFAVYVPRSIGRTIKSTQLLPRRAAIWMGKKMGVTDVFLNAIDAPERDRYERRVGG